MENNPSQKQVSAYFATHSDKEGDKLFLSQSLLLKKLEQKDKIRAMVSADPNALSMKCVHIVTCPEVDAALGLWM
jgi:hypothetical protein